MSTNPANHSAVFRSIIITGGNSGLGYACARALLRDHSDKAPSQVILACRDLARAQGAVDRLRGEIKGVGSSSRVESMRLDLASLASVREFAGEVGRRLGSGDLAPLHGLACNAGVQSGGERTFTADGFESTFGVNHLGHFFLVNLLLPRMVPPAPGGRGVERHARPRPEDRRGRPRLERPDGPGPGRARAPRGRRFPLAVGPAHLLDVQAGQCPLQPRTRPTVAGRGDGQRLRPRPDARHGAGPRPGGPAPFPVAPDPPPGSSRSCGGAYANTHTPAESGAALARLLIDPALEGTSGQYFEGMREIPSSTESYDAGRAGELWQASVSLTGSDATVG